MHYMVDISRKIEEIREMVDYGHYFTINRPRQYGKTTVINTLSNTLRDKYIVIDTSFEGVSDAMFNSEEEFCSGIFDVFANSVEMTDKELAMKLRKYQKEIDNYNSLSKGITDLIKDMGKGIVLLIDEVDKNSNNRTFLKFLGLLRNKYLSRNSGKDITFQSVILSGVHDIKNMKLAIRDESEAHFNSPWNISAKFKVDMSFNVREIESMLIDYCKDNKIKFDTALIAAEIHRFTSGYPFLVSNICLVIEEELNMDWTLPGVYNAVKVTLMEKNTLFEDVIKNIENNKDIKSVVYEILVEGRKINYNPDTYEKGIMYGILAERNGKLSIHNKIFEERIYNFLIEQKAMREMSSRFTSINENTLIENGSLNMQKALLKFQEFMYEEYRQEDEKFYETNGRLIFLAYLKPILNGRGFSFVEAQTRENRRMDVVIIFGSEKFIVELKIWNGKKYEDKGFEQLSEYLDIQKLNRGYMVVFNFNRNKKYSSGWIEIKDKKIFEVVV
jgi:hypothetical protein